MSLIDLVSSFLIIIYFVGIIILGSVDPEQSWVPLRMLEGFFCGGVTCECCCCIFLLCLRPSSTSTLCYLLLRIHNHPRLDVFLLSISALVLCISNINLASVIFLYCCSIVSPSLFACCMFHHMNVSSRIVCM